MAISGCFSSTILNSVFVIQQETVGLGQNIICIKNNGGVGGATITGDTYFKILATGDTGSTTIETSKIIATSNVTTNTGNIYALEGSFISTKSEVSGLPLFGNFQAYQTIDAGDPAHFNFYKTRDGRSEEHNDTIGKMIFYGQDSDGTYIQGGQIRLTVKGTVATNRVGGELSFWTHPDSDSSG